MLLAKNPGEITNEALITTVNIKINVLENNCLSQPCKNEGRCFSFGNDQFRCNCTKGIYYDTLVN